MLIVNYGRQTKSILVFLNVAHGGFPRMKHACNAAMPVACTVHFIYKAHAQVSQLFQSCNILLVTFRVKNIVTFCVKKLLHFALKSCYILRQKLLHFASKVVTFHVNVTFYVNCYILRRNNTSCAIRETYELFYRESMQTGRTDPQEIRNQQLTIFQEIISWLELSQIISHPDLPPSGSFSRLKELGLIHTAQKCQMEQEISGISKFPEKRTTPGAFHSTTNSEISGPKLNGTFKIPGEVFENLGIRFECTLFDGIPELSKTLSSIRNRCRVQSPCRA